MARVKQSPREIEAMIRRQARGNAEVRKELVLLGRRVHRYWKRIAPVGDMSGQRYQDRYMERHGRPMPAHWQQTDPMAGSYKGGIIHRAGKRKKNGYPVRVIQATDWKSHWIEYGTGGATPTPEFACRQRTATRFGAMGGVSVKRKGVRTVNKKATKVGVTALRINGRPNGQTPRRGQGYEDAA